jgi:hypothetical protein
LKIVKEKNIVITGNELGEYKDFKELAGKLKNFYRENIKGGSSTHPQIGKVDFYDGGVGKTVSSAKGNTDILKTMAKIKEIVERGKNIGESEANKERKDKATFISIEKGVTLENVKRKATALIRKQPDNRKDFYTLYLDLKKKKKD